MVSEYGGEIWVEDNHPEGSVFVVELPTAEYKNRGSR
jgi:signal transduction histidine kinase